MKHSSRLTLTLDVEGGVAGLGRLFGRCVFGDAHEVPGVQPPVHRRELQVASFLEAPLIVLQALAIVKPSVRDIRRIADFAAQHGTAAVQSILGRGFLGEVDGGGLVGQH